ncbi:pre-B lymphocyte protein 3-like [Python bivittatus]|uniref:Pre-B lymphocyte protein 3-like n=1 Tax=Python bivittatus TaxID=176946 RepID=A0A9F5JEJ7_PYTBI|nr:pre-B lymphocyte protein 3-like [Python bivittatus]
MFRLNVCHFRPGDAVAGHGEISACKLRRMLLNFQSTGYNGISLFLPYHQWCAGDTTTSLIQPVSVSAFLGNAAQISCTISNGNMTTSIISWIQHKHPNTPKYLLYYKNKSIQRIKTGVSERFAAFKDVTLNTCYLTISGVQAVDEGTYYCLTSTGPE